jgi:HK97 family phage major capsid protein
MKDINDLMQERGKLIEDMKVLALREDAEGKAEFDRVDAAQNELKAQADKLKKIEDASREIEFAPKAAKLPIGDKADKPRNSAEFVNAFVNGYIRKGQYSNALEVGIDDEGGYLAHDSFDTMFREIRDDYNPLRQFVDVVTTSGDHNIRVEAGLGASTWGDEESSYSESAPSFGNAQLLAHKLKRLVKVSQELLQDSDFGIEAYLARAIGRSHGIAEEAAFIAGLGAGSYQPTGMMSGASAASTAETAVTEAAIYDLFFGLGRVYRSNATWIFNDATVRTIRGIENGSGDKIWQPSMLAGTPDTVLGRPFVTSAHMGVASTSPEEVVAIFGDMKNYTIADRTGLSIQRLDELYATTGQVGFQAWSRTDGKVIQSAGIKSLTLAAS